MPTSTPRICNAKQGVAGDPSINSRESIRGAPSSFSPPTRRSSVGARRARRFPLDMCPCGRNKATEFRVPMEHDDGRREGGERRRGGFDVVGDNSKISEISFQPRLSSAIFFADISQHPYLARAASYDTINCVFPRSKREKLHFLVSRFIQDFELNSESRSVIRTKCESCARNTKLRSTSFVFISSK